MQAVRPRAALNAQLLRINEGYRSAGIARYILYLLRELPLDAADFQFDVYATEPRAPALLSNFSFHTTRLPVHKPMARIFWEQTLFAFDLWQKNYALLHSLAYVTPFFNRTPSVVTLYDMSFFLYPEYFPPLQRLYLKLGTRVSAQRARRLVTISESTKRDAVRLLNVAEDKIDVAYPGVGAEFFQAVDSETLDAFRRAKRLPEHFVLFIGTREPRKNIPALLRAFAIAKRARNFPHQLVLAGGRGWMDEEIPRAIAETGLEKQIIFPGFVPHDELPLWYRAADALVYPSQYEGFGMPPLEALACGTPTITSNVSSLPEAVGDAALLIDPQSPQQIAAALERVLSDDALRHEMRLGGPAYARQFSWTRAAQVTAQTYRLALGMEKPISLLRPVSN